MAYYSLPKIKAPPPPVPTRVEGNRARRSERLVQEQAGQEQQKQALITGLSLNLMLSQPPAPAPMYPAGGMPGMGMGMGGGLPGFAQGGSFDSIAPEPEEEEPEIESTYGGPPPSAGELGRYAFSEGSLLPMRAPGAGANPLHFEGPLRSPVWQLDAADQQFHRAGLPPVSGTVSGITPVQGIAGAYQDSGRLDLNPQRGQPQPWTAMHEGIHTLEGAMTKEEQLQLQDLMAANPPPGGMPTAHHPTREVLDAMGLGLRPGTVNMGPEAFGLTNYFDHLYGGFPEHLAPNYTPAGPIDPDNVYSRDLGYDSTGPTRMGQPPSPLPPAIYEWLRDNMAGIAARSGHNIPNRLHGPGFARGGTVRTGRLPGFDRGGSVETDYDEDALEGTLLGPYNPNDGTLGPQADKAAYDRWLDEYGGPLAGMKTGLGMLDRTMASGMSNAVSNNIYQQELERLRMEALTGGASPLRVAPRITDFAEGGDVYSRGSDNPEEDEDYQRFLFEQQVAYEQSLQNRRLANSPDSYEPTLENQRKALIADPATAQILTQQSQPGNIPQEAFNASSTWNAVQNQMPIGREDIALGSRGTPRGERLDQPLYQETVPVRPQGEGPNFPSLLELLPQIHMGTPGTPMGGGQPARAEVGEAARWAATESLGTRDLANRAFESAGLNEFAGLPIMRPGPGGGVTTSSRAAPFGRALAEFVPNTPLEAGVSALPIPLIGDDLIGGALRGARALTSGARTGARSLAENQALRQALSQGEEGVVKIPGGGGVREPRPSDNWEWVGGVGGKWQLKSPEVIAAQNARRPPESLAQPDTDTRFRELMDRMRMPPGVPPRQPGDLLQLPQYTPPRSQGALSREIMGQPDVMPMGGRTQPDVTGRFYDPAETSIQLPERTGMRPGETAGPGFTMRDTEPPRPPPEPYPSFPGGTMASEFPGVVGQPHPYFDIKNNKWIDRVVKPNTPAASMGAPLAYDPQYTPGTREFAAREAFEAGTPFEPGGGSLPPPPGRPAFGPLPRTPDDVIEGGFYKDQFLRPGGEAGQAMPGVTPQMMGPAQAPFPNQVEGGFSQPASTAAGPIYGAPGSGAGLHGGPSFTMGPPGALGPGGMPNPPTPAGPQPVVKPTAQQLTAAVQGPGGVRVQGGNNSVTARLVRDALVRADVEIPAYSRPKSVGAILSNTRNGIAESLAGNYADPYLNQVIRMGDDLRANLADHGLAATDLDKRVDDFQWALINKRYADPADASRRMDAWRQLEKHYVDGENLSKDLAGWNRVTGAVKNAVFGLLDVGFFGQTMLAGLWHSWPQVIAGLLNRGSLAVHALPYMKWTPAFDLEKLYTLPRTAAARNMGLDLTRNTVLNQGGGSPLGLIPGLEGLDRRTLGAALEKSSELQFKTTGGFFKMMDLEGSLALEYMYKFLTQMAGNTATNIRRGVMDLAGALDAAKKTATDFTMNPVNQRHTANTVNNHWSSSKLAVTPGRKELERQFILSPAFFRAKIDRVTDMLKLVRPDATEIERVLAAQTAMAYIGSTLLIYPYINDQIGIKDAVTDPFAFGFGQVTLPLRNSQGEHIKIDLLPQDSFQNVITRTLNAVKQGDPEKVGDAWMRYGFGALNLFPKAVIQGATGLGYDAAGRFHGPLSGESELSTRTPMTLGERLQANLPVPPVAKNLITGQDTDAASLGITAAGVTSFGETALNEYMGEKVEKERALNSALMEPNLLNLAYPGETDIQREVMGQEWQSLLKWEKADLIAAVEKADPARAKELREADAALDRLNDVMPSAIGNANRIRDAGEQDLERIRTEYSSDFKRYETQLFNSPKDGYITRQAIAGFEEAQKQKEAESRWRFSTTYTGLPYNESGKLERIPGKAQQVLTEYNGLGNSLNRLPDGSFNFNGYNALRLDFLTALKKEDVGTYNRLTYHLARQAEEADAKKPEVLKFMDWVQDTSLKEYYTVPEGSRTQWVREHPAHNAALWVAGYQPNLYTIDAVLTAEDLAPGRNPRLHR